MIMNAETVQKAETLQNTDSAEHRLCRTHLWHKGGWLCCSYHQLRAECRETRHCGRARCP